MLKKIVEAVRSGGEGIEIYKPVTENPTYIVIIVDKESGEVVALSREDDGLYSFSTSDKPESSILRIMYESGVVLNMLVNDEYLSIAEIRCLMVYLLDAEGRCE